LNFTAERDEAREQTMMDPQPPITVSEARQRVAAALFRLGHERIALDQAAGRVLARDVVADLDMPPFARVCMDGFAVRSADLCAGAAEFEVLEVVGAGQVPGQVIAPGTTIQVMTGSVLPAGADAVVMVEHSKVLAPQRVLLEATARPGDHVEPRGALFAGGDVIVRAGKLLRAPELALLATVGAAEPQVVKRPRVRLVATGNELVEVGTRPAPGQIRESTRYALRALVEQEGGSWLGASRAPDDRAALRSAFEAALADTDILLITGGVSAGEYDLVEPILDELGFERRLTAIRLKPGKPAVFAVRGQQLAFGLPGNPVSSIVVMLLLGIPALRYLGGRHDLDLPRVRARLTAPLHVRASDREQYLPGLLAVTHTGHLAMTPLPWRGSSDMVGIAAANAFACLHAATSPPAVDEDIEVLLWRDPLL
jgi:molybdopterin molybdotransferase